MDNKPILGSRSKVLLVTLFAILSQANAQSFIDKDQGSISNSSKEPYQISDFGIPLQNLVSPENHIWVMSGNTTVNPKANTVFGVQDFYSPPLAAVGFRMSVSLDVNGHEVEDLASHGKGDVGLLYSGGVWFPDRIVRKGTYNHIIDGRPISFGVETSLVPLFGDKGFLLKVEITNRTSEIMKIDFTTDLDPGAPYLKSYGEWTFGAPKNLGETAHSKGESKWGNNQVELALIEKKSKLSLTPGETSTSYIVVLANKNGEKLRSVEPEELENTARNAWESRIATYTKNVPVLHSSNKDLEDYYNRSLTSGLVCIWQNPDFVINPFIAAAGIDGGAICTYGWDVGGYNPQILTLMLDEDVKKVLKGFTKIDLMENYAYTPDGSGTGPRYAYSPWSYISFVWAIARHLGINEKIFNSSIKIMEDSEAFYKGYNGLFDYGTQHNLLEMRGEGWQHIVASPNAERAWCYDRLADMGQQLGYEAGKLKEWRSKAETIRQNVRTELWDKDKQWFVSKFPNGHKELTYSIQAYDAYRAGVCTPHMEKALLSHLRDGAFLGKYGVSSVSAEDKVNYELNDTDWSGGGCYSGEGPQLALTLYEKKQSKLAWDVLQRDFWMGRLLPYYPQEHYNNKPEVAGHKRANLISGLMEAEAIIYGLAGFTPKIDGSLWINPQPPEEENVSLFGVGFKDHLIDIILDPSQLQVKVDGTIKYKGVPKMVKILDADQY